MKLLDVEVVLSGDKGIQQAKHKPEVMKESDDTTARYAILSHRWGAEVDYEEMIGLMEMEEEEREEVKQRHGYQKIIKSCKQAAKDGHKWLWVDTCCIDKRSSAELSEAINSMYRWYKNAQVCYAYLNDVGESTFPTEEDNNKFGQSNGWPVWFVRGWTLQELIAPKEVQFFNKDWVHIGDKRHLAPTLARITGIPSGVLTSGLARKRLSVAQIMSWAAERRTMRVEDRAYSLMGLFGVNMPMVYGEGKKAFQRLQLEIIRMSSDQSIFAWNPRIPRTGSVLAEDPSDFWLCGGIKKVEPDEFYDKLMRFIGWQKLCNPRYIQRNPQEIVPAHSQQLRTFTVSNAGIQVCLPVVPLPDSPSHYRALLACTYGLSLIDIDLVSTGSSFDRMPRIGMTPATYPEFRTLYLTHHQDVSEKCRTFILDDVHASYYGFRRCATYPCGLTGDAVTLSSLTGDLIVVVYANGDAGVCFVIGLGYHYGQEWVHVHYDGCSATAEENWTDFGRRAYDRMWEARSKHARDMAEHGRVGYGKYCMKHVHFSRSIRGARVVWGRWEADEFKVMVDVVDCPGGCDGPCRTTITLNDWDGLAMPGLMKTVSCSYSLQLDERLAQLDDCGRFALGDYGDYSHGNLVRAGNIFEDMRAAGMDDEDSVNFSEVCRISSPRQMAWMKNQDDLVVADSYFSEKCLALHHPRAFSLPANGRVSHLLKALSGRLAGKHLVTTIVQCSDFYTFDENGNRRDSYSHDNSAPARVNHSTDARILSPLCVIASPQVWRREQLHLLQMDRFRSNQYRRHFDALVDMHPHTGTEQFDKFLNRQKKDIAVHFFLDLFGFKYLRNYIGKITFFARFLSMMETSPVSNVLSTSVEEENGLRAHLPKISCAKSVTRCNLLRGGRQVAAAESDPRLEAVLPLLLERCQSLCAPCDAPSRDSVSRRVEGEINFISQTLGADLFKHINIAFCNAYREHELTGATHRVSPVKYDRQLDTLSVVQDIKALHAQLDATRDEDEQRTLEEDVTGKILWLLWCGICVEVDELLPKVVHYIRKAGGTEGLGKICLVKPSVDPSDDQTHLQRIMYDAGANISKYQLWFDARATEHAKWSSTNRSTPTIDQQGVT